MTRNDEESESEERRARQMKNKSAIKRSLKRKVNLNPALKIGIILLLMLSSLTFNVYLHSYYSSTRSSMMVTDFYSSELFNLQQTLILVSISSVQLMAQLRNSSYIIPLYPNATAAYDFSMRILDAGIKTCSRIFSDIENEIIGTNDAWRNIKGILEDSTIAYKSINSSYLKGRI